MNFIFENGQNKKKKYQDWKEEAADLSKIFP